jgi:hypothetical protein
MKLIDQNLGPTELFLHSVNSAQLIPSELEHALWA